jgi:hypothetical protein
MPSHLAGAGLPAMAFVIQHFHCLKIRYRQQAGSYTFCVKRQILNTPPPCRSRLAGDRGETFNT